MGAKIIKISDLTGSWKMTDDEVEGLIKVVREGWRSLNGGANNN